MLDRGSCRAAETLLVAGVVAALALLLVVLLPGPRFPQVVILLVGGVLIGPEVLGWADRPAIDLLVNVGERRSAKSVPRIAAPLGTTRPSASCNLVAATVGRRPNHPVGVRPVHCRGWILARSREPAGWWRSGGAAVSDRDRPNILVIWGDDIGITNLSCYSDGLMGYRTPNIDRIAAEGMRFTDSYGEQSCTAGRSSFITGQSVFRTGLSKVGVPAAPLGLQAEDPTIAELLKPLGYATGQFGKNHLGDKNEFLPTVHGFDEFYGNLYHLNAEEDPESPNYPPAADFPHFRERFGPRGVLHCWATEEDDATEEPRWGRVGHQRVEDTGPLTRKRMETIDDEVLEHALDFIDRQHQAGTPFFVWFNTTHMHFRTHPKPESVGQAGRWQSPYHDTMIDHDKVVGALLDKLDDLGIAEHTIVVYSTDNGPHMNSWPDAGMTPFRSEKNSNWEGAFRIPELVRWPGRIPAGVVSNEIIQHHDWLPTLLAAAGDPDIVEKLKQGHTAGDRTFRVHIDGFNLLPYLTGEVDKSPRQLFVYFSDDGDVLAVRFDNWKVVFMEQRVQGTLQIWAEPFVPLRLPKLFNLRTDPFERADITSNTYWDWVLDSGILVLTAAAVVGQFLQTFEDFPPRQRAASFTIDQVVAKLENALTTGR